MLFHACWILVYRPSLTLHDFAHITPHVQTCIDHSVHAETLAAAFHRTFAGTMTYQTMYSAFVAA